MTFTYRQLLQILPHLSENQLDSDVTIGIDGEYSAVASFECCSFEEGRLYPLHPILKPEKEFLFTHQRASTADVLHLIYLIQAANSL